MSFLSNFSESYIELVDPNTDENLLKNGAYTLEHIAIAGSISNEISLGQHVDTDILILKVVLGTWGISVII